MYETGQGHAQNKIVVNLILYECVRIKRVVVNFDG
jgi:hypothetical protein